MKITCPCNRQLVDSTDALPYKAHIISDRDWHPILDAIDAAIEETGSSRAARETACMAIRSLLNGKTRQAWQCPACGTLYLDAEENQLHRFTPASETVPKDLLDIKEQVPQ
ncbi:MAG: hypothetical protein GKR89_35140 [Candidatus Latescibacteria bacterium]|nr:hypothetical protein [Candidatus Latescibacterota bacterium]